MFNYLITQSPFTLLLLQTHSLSTRSPSSALPLHSLPPNAAEGTSTFRKHPSLIFPLFWWEKVAGAKGRGGGCHLREVSFSSFGVRLCQLRRGSAAPASPHPRLGTRRRAAPSAPLPERGEPVPHSRRLMSPPSPAAAGGCERDPAPGRQQGARVWFHSPEAALTRGAGKGGKTVSENYFCSCEAGCGAVPSSGGVPCVRPPAPAPPLQAVLRSLPLPLRSPRRRAGGTADFLFAQSESLFTSGISQRHIKESKQVQVNHEMVTF